MLMMQALFKGFALSLAMIVAIGAQNAFVLKQGLMRRHVLPVVLICALSDLLFIVLGVMAVGAVIAARPWLAFALTLGGGLFLLVYGARSFHAAWYSRSSLQLGAGSGGGSLWGALLATLAVTYLNPGVYLDTLLIIGGVGASFSAEQKPWFVVGAGLASFIWFFSVGFGARLLQPVFKQPRAWRMLELLIGVIMWSIALPLLWQSVALGRSL
ncbi:LysE/ArgO family amino acid transporter [Alcaligenes sp. SDU_A2]|uniref:LysE/ArgO family amino acid transporter n=1 Tax=Alcaligenes sp. SDU_A2 TaxID=3136634 RepID=UPI00311ECBD6